MKRGFSSDQVHDEKLRKDMGFRRDLFLIVSVTVHVIVGAVAGVIKILKALRSGVGLG